VRYGTAEEGRRHGWLLSGSTFNTGRLFEVVFQAPFGEKFLPKVQKFPFPNFRSWPKCLLGNISIAGTVNKRFSTTLTSLALASYKILVSFIVKLAVINKVGNYQ